MDIANWILVALYCVIQVALGSKFELHYKTKITWSEAKFQCTQANRIFAKVDSEEDQRWVQTLSPYVTGFFWIGLKADKTSQDFLWVDSTPAQYTNWAEGFPGKTEGLDCVRMRHFDFKWETFNCSEELTYLCQDPTHTKSYVVSDETKIKGIMMGFGVIGGVLLLCCLLLQLPCCRTNVTEKISRIGFGRKLDAKPML